MVTSIKEETFSPCIAYTGTRPVEYAAVPLTMYSTGADHLESYTSMSALLEHFYAEKNTLTGSVRNLLTCAVSCRPLWNGILKNTICSWPR